MYASTIVGGRSVELLLYLAFEKADCREYCCVRLGDDPALGSLVSTGRGDALEGNGGLRVGF
jgi:hypothetical protein